MTWQPRRERDRAASNEDGAVDRASGREGDHREGQVEDGGQLQLIEARAAGRREDPVKEPLGRVFEGERGAS